MTRAWSSKDEPLYEKSVFINCPFDTEYQPIMDAIIFSTVACGFLPRSAMETGVATPRMDRIAQCVLSSKYSIHDPSRNRGEGEHNYARFNMPLELGMVIGRSLAVPDNGDRNDWLLLVPEGHEHTIPVSDLAGFDPKKYDGTPTRVIPPVMAWLKTRPTAAPGPMPKAVIEELPRFMAAREELVMSWAGDVPWEKLVVAASEAAAPLMRRSD
jgi:hypothetical protein